MTDIVNGVQTWTPARGWEYLPDIAVHMPSGDIRNAHVKGVKQRFGSLLVWSNDLGMELWHLPHLPHAADQDAGHRRPRHP